MTGDVGPRPARRINLWMGVVALVVLAVVAAVVVGVKVHDRNVANVRSDQFSCTLSGMGPLDVGPKTGRLCADLLRGLPGITGGS